jgi:hypothetical protein
MQRHAIIETARGRHQLTLLACTLGYEFACMCATRDLCVCQCGGSNHGLLVDSRIISAQLVTVEESHDGESKTNRVLRSA